MVVGSSPLSKETPENRGISCINAAVKSGLCSKCSGIYESPDLGLSLDTLESGLHVMERLFHTIKQSTPSVVEIIWWESKTEKSRFKQVCVFCGSSTGKKNCYRDAALDLGEELVLRRLNLVYGGGSVGLMGLVSQTVHRGGGHVLGIIPKTLMCKEITGETVGEVKPVADMHQRKAEMARHSRLFYCLTRFIFVHHKKGSGYGTLEELLEVMTWAQLGIHDKPVGLLQVENPSLSASAVVL
ncbi:hypothetical protein NE237_017884 [Protea cynaroides]|uniref:Cytokinin riboside 5'-monophosphate phosphoribohydrolase n=1 Tax=Protea cynaroides TaxID=273540 RepID=A0A9Q0K8X5_9MAGN|nr:hypothetical protein NE237_017884 [Protea cynaroides]